MERNMKPKKPIQLILILLAVVLLGLLGRLGITPQIIPDKQPDSTAGAVVLLTAAPQTETAAPTRKTATPKPAAKEPGIQQDGAYTSAEDIAAYLIAYQELPDNFITKAQARALGWQGGDLRPFAPGKAIGGDRFGNYEGLLPAKKGRVYYECDVDTLGQSSRGAKRLVYSNDGLIFFTDDHYASFTRIYGGE